MNCPVNLSICKQYDNGKCKAKQEDECPVNNEYSIFEKEELLNKLSIDNEEEAK